MSEICLGVNNCFAIGRFPEPEEWLRIITDELGLKYLQFSFDLLDPVILDDEIVKRESAYIKKLADEKGVIIDTASTGELPHKSNLLLAPDADKRKCHLRWYEKLIRAGGIMGVKGCGVYLGTMSQKDVENPERKEFLIQELMDEIEYLTSVAKEEGQEYFLWENMSIPREIPCTIDQTKELIEKANQKAHVPVKLCLDVGHGYIRSGDPRDSDPYEWLRELGHLSPTIHMLQFDTNKLADPASQLINPPKHQLVGIIVNAIEKFLEFFLSQIPYSFPKSIVFSGRFLI